MLAAAAVTTGPVWVAWPRATPPGPWAGAAPWGVMYLPANRWVLFGPEALCRALVALLLGRRLAV